jgi:Putative abortive phage resistance protein AbiGi, antitoxin
MPTQRYVSPELTHFVGKRLSEDQQDQQYSLLVNDILKAGWLMHPSFDRPPKEGLSGSPLVGGTPTPDVDDTEAAYWRGICFCDIPVTDLEIHMNKYSRFGLSFLKHFLVDQGANPVLYVAKNSQALSFGLPGSHSGYDMWPRHKVFKGNIQLFSDNYLGKLPHSEILSGPVGVQLHQILRRVNVRGRRGQCLHGARVARHW